MFRCFVCMVLIMGASAHGAFQPGSLSPANSRLSEHARSTHCLLSIDSPKTPNNSICMLVYSVVTQICQAELKWAKQTRRAQANYALRLCVRVRETNERFNLI